MVFCTSASPSSLEPCHIWILAASLPCNIPGASGALRCPCRLSAWMPVFSVQVESCCFSGLHLSIGFGETQRSTLRGDGVIGHEAVNLASAGDQAKMGPAAHPKAGWWSSSKRRGFKQFRDPVPNVIPLKSLRREHRPCGLPCPLFQKPFFQRSPLPKPKPTTKQTL